MIVVVNLNPQAATRRGTRRIVAALKRLAPTTKIVERHFARVTADGLDAMGARAVILGPQGVPFDAYPAARLLHMLTLIRSLTLPTLGICGGHQALALAHGGLLGPVHGGTASQSYEGLRKETGLRSVALARDPLTVSLPAECSFEVRHVEGVSDLPGCFTLIGRGDPCAVQLIRLTGRPIYGAQFHPELGGDGIALLQGFLSLAGFAAT
jgi:GMP synthase (glutamine-hydrolysing)